jgi:hypothetical protein
LFETRAAALRAYALFVAISEELGRLVLESEQRLAATAPIPVVVPRPYFGK